MKALTICQPWAWAAINGILKVENRVWKTEYRGILVVHAGKSTKYMKEGIQILEKLRHKPNDHDIHFGCILGIVKLVDVLPVDKCRKNTLIHGPYCWILKNPKKLEEPIPCVGRQKLFEIKNQSTAKKLLDLV